MTVLLVNYEYPPIGAGAATATQQIACCLVALGHHPIVLTSGFGTLRGPVEESGVRVLRLNSPRRKREASSVWEMAAFGALAASRVRQLIRAERVQAVIAFFSIPCGPVAWWAHRGTGVPYVVSLRGGDVPGTEPGLRFVHSLLSPVRRKLLREARAVVANSPGLKTLSESADPLPVQVIANGVDADFFSPRAAARLPGPFRFLFVGRFQTQKNLPWLLRRLATLGAQNLPPFTIDLVGDGPQRTELTRLAESLGLAPFVSWHGWLPRERLVAIYQNADAILNPSNYEGMPNVLLEAMACGLPVLASDVPGNDAVVVTGVTGHLFTPGDETTFLVHAQSWLMNRAVAADLGAAGRARVVQNFSWLSSTRSYLKLFSTP